VNLSDPKDLGGRHAHRIGDLPATALGLVGMARAEKPLPCRE
jgi:hypothetical protein